VVAYTNHQLEEEGELLTPEVGAPGEEMTGHGASRLATLLPLVRNVLVVLIVTLSGMIVLSNMGVDIAPLFAGAGVIGLAVGFGAQTMIRDIFSGGFFLFDDAFRKGEYIELGEIRGTVEKISLRSFQLRHHNGPLHTVPFGEITQLTNYSRDWVMMKLPLRVTYETDVERVRKLVKKLGQSLLEHPEVGSLFLQPLKSQGVYKMEDSAMIIRVKFMTKPGDQFVTRKVVYAAIRELFEREGIRFANKEVTVRIEREPELRLTKEEEQAVAAAARRVTDDEIAEQAPQKADDGP
jgi:small-conductance mechanosensitive channel